MLHSCNLAFNYNALVSPIHDSWGTRISDCLTMREIVKHSMFDIHNTLDFKEVEALPNVKMPEKGRRSLDELSSTMIS